MRLVPCFRVLAHAQCGLFVLIILSRAALKLPSIESAFTALACPAFKVRPAAAHMLTRFVCWQTRATKDSADEAKGQCPSCSLGRFVFFVQVVTLLVVVVKSSKLLEPLLMLMVPKGNSILIVVATEEIQRSVCVQ